MLRMMGILNSVFVISRNAPQETVTSVSHRSFVRSTTKTVATSTIASYNVQGERSLCLSYIHLTLFWDHGPESSLTICDLAKRKPTTLKTAFRNQDMNSPSRIGVERR